MPITIFNAHQNERMKNIIGFCLVAGLLACNDNATEAPEEVYQEEMQTDSFTTVPFVPGSNPESKLFVWKTSPDYSKEYNEDFKPEILQADSLIKGINEMNEQILLEKVKISGDTIYTEIKDSRYLGNEMGSTGAELYVADVVLNLTELPGIQYVNIQMEEGSHVQPGTWSKKNFQKFKPSK